MSIFIQLDSFYVEFHMITLLNNFVKFDFEPSTADVRDHSLVQTIHSSGAHVGVVAMIDDFKKHFVQFHHAAVFLGVR